MAELIGVEVKIDTTKARNQVKQLEDRLKRLGVEFAEDEKIQKQTVKQVKKTSQAYQEYENLVRKVNDAYLDSNKSTEKAKEALEDTEQELDSFNQSLIDNIKTQGGAVIAFAGLTGGVIALASGLKTASQATLDFNRALGQVATLLPGQVDRVNELRDSVRDLAISQGASLDDLSSGLFDVISAFGDSAETVGRLNAVLSASKAGGATASDSLRLLSAVTKAYNDTSSDAIALTSDLAFVTNKLGQTTFTELAGSIGKVASVSATLGVRQQELFATASALTGVVGTASEVFTGLQAIEATLLKPTAELSQAFQKLGVKDGQELIKTTGGLIESLEAISEATGGSTSELAKALGSVEALKVAVPLLTNQNAKYRESLVELNNAQGATNQALNDSRAGINEVTFTLDKLQAIFTDLAVEIGDRVIPAVGEVVNAFIDTNRPAEEIREQIKGLVDTLQTVAIVGGTVGTVLGANLAKSLAGTVLQSKNLATALGSLSNVPATLASIGGAFNILLGPLGIFASGVGIIATKYSELKKVVDEFEKEQAEQSKALEDNLAIRIKFFEKEDEAIRQAGLTAEQVARLRSELGKKGFNERVKLLAKEAQAEEEQTKKLIELEKKRAERIANAVTVDLGTEGKATVFTGSKDSDADEVKKQQESIQNLKIQAEAIRLVREQKIGLEEATIKASIAEGKLNGFTKDAIEGQLELAKATDQAKKELAEQNKITKDAEALRKKLADADDFIKQQEASLKTFNEEKKTKSELLLLDLERLQASESFAQASKEEQAQLQQKIDKLKELIEEEKKRDTAEQTKKIAEAGQAYIKTLETETATIKENTQATKEKNKELIGEEEAKARVLITTGKLKDAEDELKKKILEKARAKDQANQAQEKAIDLIEKEKKAQEELQAKQKEVQEQDKKALENIDEKIKRLKEENEFIESNTQGREKLIALEKAGLKEITEGNVKLAQERLKELEILEKKNKLLKEGTTIEAEQQKKRQKELQEFSNKALADLDAQTKAVADAINSQTKKFTDFETGTEVFLPGNTPISEVRKILDDIIEEEKKAKEEAKENAERIEQEKQEALLKEQKDGKEKAEKLEQEKQAKIIQLAEFRAEKEAEALEKIKSATEELNALREKQAETEKALADAIDSKKVNDANNALNETLSTLDKISGASAGIGIDPEQTGTARLQGLRNEIRILRGEFFNSKDAEEQVELAQALDAKVKERLQLELDIQAEIQEREKQNAEERINALKEERSQQLENAKLFRDLAQGLREQVANLDVSEFASITGQQRTGILQERFREAVAQAEGGDAQAGQNLGELANTLLESARETFKSSDAFQEIFNEVRGSLEAVATSAESQAGGLEGEAQNLSDEIAFREANIKELEEQKQLQEQAVTELQQVRAVLDQNAENLNAQMETQFQALANAINETGLRDADIGNLDSRIADRLVERFGEDFLIDPAQEKIIELEQKRNEQLERANQKNDEIKNLLANIQGIQNQQLTAVPTKLQEISNKNDALIAEISELNVTFGQIANQSRANLASGF